MDFFTIHKRLFVVNMLSVILFALLSLSALMPNARPVFDIWTDAERINLVHQTITEAMLTVSAVVSPMVLSTFTLCLFVLLFVYKKRAEAFLLLGAMAGALLSVQILKQMFAVTRPLTDITAFGLSFPSGHATIAAVFFLTGLFVLEKHVTNRFVRVVLAIGACSLVLLTGFSRIYLGVHWLSDILAGFALGMFWVSLSFIILYRSQYHYGTTHPKRS